MNIDTIQCLKKRAKEDLDNNTHNLGQKEVYTIICEWEKCFEELDMYKKVNR